MARKKIRVGVIGCGSIAITAHLPSLRQLSDRVDVVAVADIRPQVARQVAGMWDVGHWYGDYHELLRRDDIDAVTVCTPEFLHGEQVVAACRAGKHVLCEKPMADSLEAADAMLAAAKAAGVKLMIGHSRRFTARYREVRRLIDQGEIGGVIHVRENERRPIAQYAAQNLPIPEWSPEGGERTWKDMSKYTYGVVLGGGIHEFDLLRWFAGAEADEIYADAQIADPLREVPDAVSATIKFKNGVLGGVDLFINCPRHYPSFHQLEIYGEHGLIRAMDPDMETLRVYRETGMTFPVAYSSLLHIDDAYTLEHRQFYDAIERDEPVPLDPWHARQALEMGLATRDACITGRPVKLPLATTTNSGGAA